jgi:hypothetical protein
MEFEKKEFNIKNCSEQEIDFLYGLSSVSILKTKVMFYEACHRNDIMNIELIMSSLLSCYYTLFASLYNPERSIDDKEIISMIHLSIENLIKCYESAKLAVNQQKN